MLAAEVDPCARIIESFESPSLAPDYPLHLGQLTRISDGRLETMHEILNVFSRQADVLVARMVVEEPKAVAARAHTFADSALSIGAWKVAECATAVERAARNPGPISLNPTVRSLSAAVVETQQAIGSLLADPSHQHLLRA